MKQGRELYTWAVARAKVAAADDFDLIGVSGYSATTLAIMEAYLQGGVDALADEVGRAKTHGAVSQADGSPL